MMLDAFESVRYNPFISYEAEITDEYDLLESRGTGESPAGNDRSNGPQSAQGKHKYPATGRDRYIAGNVLAFPQRVRFYHKIGKQGGTARASSLFRRKRRNEGVFVCHKTQNKKTRIRKVIRPRPTAGKEQTT